MKKIFRALSVFTACVVMFTHTINGVGIEDIITNEPIMPIVPVETYGLDSDVVEFLLKHNVDLSLLESDENDIVPNTINSVKVSDVYNENMRVLMVTAEARGFSDEQINNYVIGVANANPIVVNPSEVELSYIDNPPSAGPRTFDDNGIGWEIESDSGYWCTNAYATLPEITNRTGNIWAYMFFTASNENYEGLDYSQHFGIDVGISYGPGSAGDKWRGCYTVDGAMTTSDAVFEDLTAGKVLYFEAFLMENTGYLRFRILDSSLSTTYYCLDYYVADRLLTRANASFNRQISMCDPTESYNSGTQMNNAMFSNAYIFDETSSNLTDANNCSGGRKGVFGDTEEDRAKVKVTAYMPWYWENISIHFVD